MGYIYNNKSYFSTSPTLPYLISFPLIISEKSGVEELMSSPIQILGFLLSASISVPMIEVSAQISNTQSRASLVLYLVPSRGGALSPITPTACLPLGGIETHKSYT